MRATFHDDPAGEYPLDPDDARAAQRRMAGLVREEPLEYARVSTVAGLDVSYAAGDTHLVAAAVVMSVPELRVVDSAAVLAEPRFPYVPGLFAFREVPPLLDAVEALSVTPEVFVCDGFGLAHPRRFGLASHLGVLLDRRTLGVGKSPFVGHADPPAEARGSWSPLVDGGEVVGRALRTRSEVRPVYVSIGHRVDLDGASDLVLRLASQFRLPEPIRSADRLSRDVLAGRPSSLPSSRA